MPQYSTIVQKSFARGVSASAGRYEQPRGSVPRASNMLLTRRGTFKTCDGTQIIAAFNGQPQLSTTGLGRIIASILFQPVGVSPYFLFLQELLNQALGPAKNLVASIVAGGSLTSGQQYFYVVTALDGVGGETTISNEVSATPAGGSLKIKLVWNIVPNAARYNVYRGSASGTESLLIGSSTAVLPVPQSGAATVTFTDDGTTTGPAATYAIEPTGYVPYGAKVVGEGPNASIYNFNVTTAINQALANKPFTVSGCTPTSFNQAYPGGTIYNAGLSIQLTLPMGAGLVIGFGGLVTFAATTVAPPVTDTTQQTGLFALPASTAYGLANIVALFPADPQPIGGIPGYPGGPTTGGGGTTGPGVTLPTLPSSTPGGGYPPGNLSANPQMVQFINQIAMALGNSYPVNLYSDPNGTPDNPAVVAAINTISVDANGVVSIATLTPHGLSTTQLGGSVQIAGVADNNYNSNGGGINVFPVISAVDANHLTIRNLSVIGNPASSGGTITVLTKPLISTFSAAYPNWSASTTHLVGDIVQPAAPNGFYYTYTQAGITGATAPTFPLTKGQQVADGTAILSNTGPTQANAPPPPGAAHCTVFAGSLWLWNTSPNNTSNGLDGPTVLRMCDQNNPNSWNPVNQAFLDKDDGTEGMGLVSFTVTATGIPPQGSLVACKNYSTFQIIGVFGAADFAIQRIKSDMGCIAPRTLHFVPGFGIGRLSHLGVAIFDSVEDKLISDDIRPYLFPTNDADLADITVMDASWVTYAQADLVANPPMYCIAIPIGTSNGQLTRILCYDLVLRAWVPVDLPFPISNIYQARSVASNPVTLFGSWGDGTYQRWQAGDVQWATSALSSQTGAVVIGTLRSPEVINSFPMAPDTGPLYHYQSIIRGRMSDSTNGAIAIQFSMQEEAYVAAQSQLIPLGVNGMFELNTPIQEELISINMLVTVASSVEIDSINWQVKPMSTSSPARIT